MPDILDLLARSAKEEVEKGYYDIPGVSSSRKPSSLKEAVRTRRGRAIIAEVKGASPSSGLIRAISAPEAAAGAMERGGAAAISVLTERTHFGGSIEAFQKVVGSVNVPLLMKDFIVSTEQVRAASRLCADAILLIQALFNRGYCKTGVDEMVAFAHSHGLEVLLEAHTEEEYLSALKAEADLVGINNRDLATFKVDLDTTRRILGRWGSSGRLVVSESGFSQPGDLIGLRALGVDAFLIGSAIMRAEDVEAKVRGFVAA